MWHCHPLQAQCDKYWKYPDHKTRSRINSKEREGRRETSRFSSLNSRTRALCYKSWLSCICSSLPCFLEKSHLFLTGDTYYFFPILHLNITSIPLHAGTRGGFRGSCREERGGEGPSACQQTPLLVTQRTGGDGLSNAQHENILLRAKQTSLSTLPPPIQEKG